MNAIRRKVETLMRLDQQYRDSDKLLWLKVCEDFGFQLNKKQRLMFLEMPSMETIARRRREFSHKYPASEKVMERRYKHYKSYMEEFSKQSHIIKLLKRVGL